MMREASDASADSTVLVDYTVSDLEPSAVVGFRRRFQVLKPAAPENNYDEQAFLQAIGGYVRNRRTGEEGLTVAGLLLLGKSAAIREWRQRHLIDYRQMSSISMVDEDWIDRFTWEGNLFGAFEAFYLRLMSEQPAPFQLQGGTRVEESPTQVVLREALVNLLVHADYAETQASLIVRAPDGYLFRNPGSSRVLEEDLLSGHRSDPRNPTIVRMFRLIGWAEEAGSGIPRIIRSWRALGFRLPAIDVGTERYEFSLSLRPSHLISEEDRTWLGTFGESWSQYEQLALVIARHDGDVDNLKLRRLTGQHAAEATKVLGGLRNRGLLQMIGGGRAARYQLDGSALPALSQPQLPGFAASGTPLRSETSNLKDSAENLEDSPGDLADSALSLAGSSRDPQALADIPDGIRDELWHIGQMARQRSHLDASTRDDIIVQLCQIAPLSVKQVALFIGRSETHVREPLRALIGDGRLAFLYPDQPSHPRQKYRSTDLDIVDRLL